MTDFTDWLSRVAAEHDDDLPADIARRIDVEGSTIGRWRRGVTPSIGQLRAISEAYNIPMQHVMVRAGILAEDEARTVEVPTQIETFDDDALLSELRRRLVERHAAVTEPTKLVRRRRSVPKPARQEDLPMAASEREIEDWDTTPG